MTNFKYVDYFIDNCYEFLDVIETISKIGNIHVKWIDLHRDPLSILIGTLNEETGRTDQVLSMSWEEFLNFPEVYTKLTESFDSDFVKNYMIIANEIITTIYSVRFNFKSANHFTVCSNGEYRIRYYQWSTDANGNRTFSFDTFAHFSTINRYEVEMLWEDFLKLSEACNICQKRHGLNQHPK